MNQLPSLKARIASIIEGAESRIINDALEQNSYNRKATAKALDISYRGLLYKIKKYNLIKRTWRLPIMNQKRVFKIEMTIQDIYSKGNKYSSEMIHETIARYLTTRVDMDLIQFKIEEQKGQE